MRAVIQRVLRASVEVDGVAVASIQRGILTLLGVDRFDDERSASSMIEKISKLRIFPDEAGKMNLSLKDISGEHLLVSQFTLLGDCSKGNRPSFVAAGDPIEAKRIFELAVLKSKDLGISTQAGIFQADMRVDLENDGPVTFVLDSRQG
jgi:D-tyrosyl-tRNA(Tyr) deacylase